MNHPLKDKIIETINRILQPDDDIEQYLCDGLQHRIWGILNDWIEVKEIEDLPKEPGKYYVIIPDDERVITAEASYINQEDKDSNPEKWQNTLDRFWFVYPDDEVNSEHKPWDYIRWYIPVFIPEPPTELNKEKPNDNL